MDGDYYKKMSRFMDELHRLGGPGAEPFLEDLVSEMMNRPALDLEALQVGLFFCMSHCIGVKMGLQSTPVFPSSLGAVAKHPSLSLIPPMFSTHPMPRCHARCEALCRQTLWDWPPVGGAAGGSE